MLQSGKYLWRYLINGLFLLLLLSLTTACSITQSPFVRLSGATGSTLNAAAATLRYAHESKLSYPYTSASFVIYKDTLQGMEEELISRDGKPSAEILGQLLTSYREAYKIIQEPCLADYCDWQSQLKTLDQASQVFLKESEQ